MALSFEVPVRCLADLQHVDSRVRVLCNTSTGAQCQSLLTTEYQSWRHRVALALTQAGSDGHASAHAPGVVDAFMSGFKLRFAPPTCVITTSVPCAPSAHGLSAHGLSAHGLRKRKAHSDAECAA